MGDDQGMKGCERWRRGGVGRRWLHVVVSVVERRPRVYEEGEEPNSSRRKSKGRREGVWTRKRSRTGEGQCRERSADSVLDVREERESLWREREKRRGKREQREGDGW